MAISCTARLSRNQKDEGSSALGSPSAGVDFKYGLTRSLIADLTYNTDFAQVEEDVQQVNLTRFSLQFPGSDLFVVYSDGRNTVVAGVPELVNRSIAVKLTRLVHF